MAGLIAALLLLLPTWLLWRFFRRYFQIYLLIFAFLAAVTGYVYYRTIGSNYQNPAIGRHAYLIETGNTWASSKGKPTTAPAAKSGWCARPDATRLSTPSIGFASR